MARSKPKPAAAAAPAVSDDRRAAIAEALIAGDPDDAVVAWLAGEGLSPSAARYEVDRARRSPYLRAALRYGARLAKRDWALGIHTRLAAADPARGIIPTVHAIDPEAFYRDFYFANRPVRLTGLVDHWPALSAWSLDALEERLGAVPIQLQAGREGNAAYEIEKHRHIRTMPLREVVAGLRATPNSNDFYVTAFNDTINKVSLAPLWDDVGDIAILRRQGPRDGFFWMGPRGTITPFHHDLTNNLLLQIVGRKRVRMVASHDLPAMRNSLHCFSDWSGDELPAGPAGEMRPAVLETVIGPGEALFLPVGWWHHVEALDVTIGMSFTNFAADNDFYSDYRSHGAL